MRLPFASLSLMDYRVRGRPFGRGGFKFPDLKGNGSVNGRLEAARPGTTVSWGCIACRRMCRDCRKPSATLRNCGIQPLEVLPDGLGSSLFAVAFPPAHAGEPCPQVE